MKKIGILAGLGLLITMLSSPVYPLSYQIDFNGEGGYDTSWEMSGGDRTRVAVWLDDYTCLPDDKLFGAQLYVAFDSNTLQVVEAFANDVTRGGPFEVSLSGFKEHKPGVYFLVASNFNYVTVLSSRILLGTIVLEATSSGSTTLKAANKLGMEGFDDGFVSDCDLKQNYPDDAMATITITGGGGDGDGNGGNGDRGSEGDAGEQFGGDSGANETPAEGNEGFSGRAGMVGADSDGAGPLSGRTMTTIPDVAEYQYPETDRNTVSQTGSGRRSSPQQSTEGRPSSQASGEIAVAPSTTTVKRPASPYAIVITPSALTINPGSVSKLSARTLFQGKEVEGTYDWKVVPASTIGSTIDKNGQFVAGINATSFNVEETIRVTDTRNGTDAETVFTITPQAQAADDCQLAINPASATLYPGDTFVFTGRALGEKCREGDYKWRVNTRIGSEITADGIYRAGRNSIGKETIDIVIVEDAVNATTAQSLVTVLLPEEAGSRGAESMQQPGKDDPAGRKFFPGVFLLVLG